MEVTQQLPGSRTAHSLAVLTLQQLHLEVISFLSCILLANSTLCFPFLSRDTSLSPRHILCSTIFSHNNTPFLSEVS